MVYGTTSGEIVLLNPHSNKEIALVPRKYAIFRLQLTLSREACSILGLCWLRKTDTGSKFIAGTDTGTVRLYDVNKLQGTLTLAPNL